MYLNPSYIKSKNQNCPYHFKNIFLKPHSLVVKFNISVVYRGGLNYYAWKTIIRPIFAKDYAFQFSPIL